MFEYIFCYEVNQWFLNDIAQKLWKIMGFQNMINSHDVQLVNCFNTDSQLIIPHHLAKIRHDFGCVLVPNLSRS